MDTLPEDKQVVELISKLKYSSGAYPKDMLYSRRQQFIRQVANAGLGIGVGAAIKNAAKHSQGAGATATVTGKIIETVLITAIAIEAGTTGYIYRHKIADFFKSFTGSPDSSEIIRQPNNNSSTSQPVILPTLTPPPTSSTPSTAISPFYTPAPGVQLNNNNGSTDNNSNNGGSTTNIEATPVPTDKNGNQYGLTPKPEQTKDSNGNK